MRHPRAASLRLGAALLGAAAAILAAGGGAPRRVAVVAWDASGSVAGAAETEEEAIRAAAAGDPGAEAPRVVRFARTAGAGAPDPDGTDLGAGLRAALALVPEGAPGRVVLATDGRDTEGGIAAALAEARRRGIEVLPFPRGRGGLPARIAAVEAPAAVRAGARFPVEVLVTGSPGASLEVVLEDAAAATAERRTVAVPEGGAARAIFARTAAAPGVRAFAAGSRRAVVLVEGPGRVLRLGGSAVAPATDRLLRTLGGGSYEDAAGPAAVAAALGAANPGALAALVLDDLAEGDLPPDGGARIRDAVAGGLGLVVLGGPRSLGRGGWGGRPLEEALPVRCLPRRPRPLWVLALDASGSMEEPGPDGRPLLAAARAAAADLARRLPGDGYLAVVLFRDALLGVAGPFDLGSADGRTAAAAACAGAGGAGGGTRFGAAAEGALAAAVRSPATGGRRLVLVTDGRPAEDAAALRALGADLRAAHFEIRVVAVGGAPARDAIADFAGPDGLVPAGDAALGAALAAAAGEGGGAEWHAGPAEVRAGPDPLPFGPVPAGLPPVEGLHRTWPRPGARLGLLGPRGEPVLAAGSHGLGRVVVFPSDPAAGAGEWASGSAAPVLAAAAAAVLRPPDGGRAAATARVRPDGSAELRLECAPGIPPPASVGVRGVPLARSGPSAWSGAVPAGVLREGEIVAFADGGEVLARAAAGPAPSAEDRALGPDAAALEALVVAPGPAPGAPATGAGPGAVAASLGALALLLAAAGAGRGDPGSLSSVQHPVP